MSDIKQTKIDVTNNALSGCCKQTYEKSFSEIFAIKRQAGFASLRRTQFRLAEKSAAMAIFLGKNFFRLIESPSEQKINRADKISCRNRF